MKNMDEQNLREYKQQYARARHHAWAGLGLLTVLLALRGLFPDLPDIIVIPLAVLLVIYILVALFFTYKYRTGLSAREEIVPVEPSVEIEKEKTRAEVEKERLKVEKKKAKAEAKAQKKAQK